MKRFSLILVLVSLGTFIGGCKEIVNKLAFHPDNINVIPENSLPDGIEEFSVETEDHIKIRGLYLPAKESDKVVIYFHGNAGNIYHRIPSLIQLRKFGLNVVGVSYRGYGKSEGEPTEDGVYLDGKATFDYVSKGLGFSHKNIIVIGRSIGTTVAINTAQNKDIAGLILVTPLSSGKAHANAGSLSSVSFLAGDSFNNMSKMNNIKTSILVIHGTKDRVIPYSMGKEIFDAANTRKKFVTIDGAGHNNLHDVYGEEYWVPILNFLKSTLSS
ncbi:MAG: fermentation-respiration switch protein FrsA (DUF1100 family) [Oleiphilaceae bacterium]|jgi:fermentation-respiration switch protein FrsA (DUF1100 family)